MAPEYWGRVHELLSAARQRQPKDRTAFLAEACGADHALRDEIERLLAREEQIEWAPGHSGGLGDDRPQTIVVSLGQLGWQPPTKLKGRYVIERELGRGGFGVVYLAHDEQLHLRPVVIKVLLVPAQDTEWFQKKFRQEREALARIDHPGVVGVLDSGEIPDGRPFLVLQFVDGITLRSVMSAGPLPLARVATIVRQIAHALTAAHLRGVSHRDLKPENVMLQDLGEGEELVKIIDFGIASLKESQTSAQAEQTRVAGSIHYMAPEQLMGTPGPASDTYSLGVIAYEMIAGQRPFDPTSAAHLHFLQKEGFVTRPTSLRSELPQAAEDCILKALAVEAADRYPQARDFGDGLARALAETQPRVESEPHHAVVALLRSLLGLSAISRRSALWIPIVCFCMALLAGVAYWRIASARAIRSIAVLPFINVGMNPELEYLSDGMTESMINGLSRIHDLRVMSRSAVFPFQGSRLDPIETGRRLHVDAVLTGAIHHSSGRIEVSVELVDTASGRHIWGERYREPAQDLLISQRSVVEDTATRIRSRLNPDEKRRIARNYTANVDAYRLYLRGRYEWNKRTLEGYDAAIGYYKQALEIDPAYALAYSGTADAYATKSGSRFPDESFPPARTAATKALAIDPDLAEAHASLGFIHLQYDWDWPGAELEFRTALTFNPNYPTAHSMYARLLTVLGRFTEAEREILNAQRLDPLSVSIANGVAFQYYLARDYSSAEKQFKNNLVLDPSAAVTKSYLACSYVAQRRTAEAIKIFESLLAADPSDHFTMADLARSYAQDGRWREASLLRARLKEIAKRDYVPPTDLAAADMALRDVDGAISNLKRAYAERDWHLIYLNVDPLWDPLRNEARFRVLLREMNLGG